MERQIIAGLQIVVIVANAAEGGDHGAVGKCGRQHGSALVHEGLAGKARLGESRRNEQLKNKESKWPSNRRTGVGDAARRQPRRVAPQAQSSRQCRGPGAQSP